jgi:hypothetical protein
MMDVISEFLNKTTIFPQVSQGMMLYKACAWFFFLNGIIFVES